MSLRDLMGVAASEDTVLEQEVNRYNHDFLAPYAEELAHIGLALRMTYEQRLEERDSHAKGSKIELRTKPLTETDMVDRMEGFSKYESGRVELNVTSNGRPLFRTLRITSQLMSYAPSAQRFETVTGTEVLNPMQPKVIHQHEGSDEPEHQNQLRISEQPTLRTRDMEMIQGYLKPEEFIAFRRNLLEIERNPVLRAQVAEIADISESFRTIDKGDVVTTEQGPSSALIGSMDAN